MVIFPVHPRTKKQLVEFNLSDTLQTQNHRLRMIDPVGYMDMLILEQNARLILTDSGGIQKEAYFFGVPCLTLRPETEWIETVHTGWNTLVGTQLDQILLNIHIVTTRTQTPPDIFGSGQAARAISMLLEEFYTS